MNQNSMQLEKCLLCLVISHCLGSGVKHRGASVELLHRKMRCNCAALVLRREDACHSDTLVGYAGKHRHQ